MLPLTYKDYTIVQDDTGSGGVMLYPADSKPEHDYSYEDDRYKYCGNCVWADDIEEAKEIIDGYVEQLESDQKQYTNDRFSNNY